ncbi:hypothetical protein [Peristeroidobacter agariperforans]|uniref:hypothetical protein n=1 Tax=Peristeroidobacter agariperforans TaxID=268404 RepID=UPI00101DFDB8|nr:hypothetical protein [Peristeroidobacter agariperforans]
MRIAKPLLLVTTPIGVAGAIYEAYRQAGGLVILMVALMSLIAVAFGSLVYTIRREAAQEKLRTAAKVNAAEQS